MQDGHECLESMAFMVGPGHCRLGGVFGSLDVPCSQCSQSSDISSNRPLCALGLLQTCLNHFFVFFLTIFDMFGCYRWCVLPLWWKEASRLRVCTGNGQEALGPIFTKLRWVSRHHKGNLIAARLQACCASFKKASLFGFNSWLFEGFSDFMKVNMRGMLRRCHVVPWGVSDQSKNLRWESALYNANESAEC